MVHSKILIVLEKQVRIPLILLLFVASAFGSKAQEKTLNPPKPQAQSKFVVKGNTYAVIVGISHYPYIKPLNWSDQDAILFKNFLQSPAGGNVKEENIFYLLNDSAKSATFYLKALRKIKEWAPKKDDRIYFYFSGHGDALNEDNFFFLTYDCNPAGDKNNYVVTGTIDMHKLKTLFIKPLVVSGAEVFLIMDCCRTHELPGGEEGQQLFAKNTQAISEKKVGEIIMLSTEAGNVAMESSQFGHSLFTYHLVDALSGLADEKDDADGYISLIELKEWVGKKVRLDAKNLFQFEQIPYFSSENNSMIIAKVDSGYLKNWIAVKTERQKIKGNEISLVKKQTASNKSSDSAFMDTTLIAVYNNFNRALKSEKLIDVSSSDHSSAEFFYGEIERKWPQHSLREEARYSLATEFINYGQQKINLYLSGKDIVHIEKLAQSLQTDNSEKNKTDTSRISKGIASVPSLMQEQVKQMERIAKLRFSDAAYMMEKAIQLLKSEKEIVQTLYPKYWFLKAKSYQTGEDKKMTYDQAMEYSRKALKADTNAAYTYHLIGHLFREKKNDSSLYYYQKASVLAPSWSYPLNELGLHYFDKKNYTLAESFFLKGLNVDSADVYILQNLADMYKATKRMERAEEYYLKVIDLNPKEALNYNSLGVLYYDMKKAKEAEKYYRKAIDLDSNAAYANYNLGLVYEVLTLDYPKAEFQFKKVLGINPNYVAAISGLAYLYEKQDRNKEAEEQFLKVIKIEPAIASHYNTLGVFYYNNKQYHLAEKSYLQTLQKDPVNRYAVYNLGLLYAYQTPHDYKKAESYFKKAILFDSVYVNAWEQLAEVYKKQRKYDLAEEQYLTAVRLDSGNVDRYNSLGIFYYDIKKPGLAEKYFNKTIAVDPKYYYAYNNLGLVYENLYKNYPKAEEYYLKTLEMNPKYSLAMTNLATFYKKQKKIKEAEQFLLKAIKTNPDAVENYNVLANLYYEDKRTDEAEQYYNKVIQLDKKYKEAYYNLGQVNLNVKKDTAKALTFYLKALEIDPAYVFALSRIADYYKIRKQDGKLIQLYQEAFKADPGNPELYNSLGSYYYGRKNYDSAIVIYSKAITVDPDYAFAWQNLALCYEYLNQHSKAKDHYWKAASINPNDPKVWNSLGYFYEKQKNYDSAIVNYSKAITVDPDYALAWQNLGLCYEYLNQYNKAKDHYWKAASINPNDPKVWNNLGYFYEKQKNYDSAIFHYSNSVRVDESFTLGWSNLIICYEETRQYEMLIQTYKRLLAKDSLNHINWNKLGNSYRNLKKYDSAIICYSKALSIDSRFASAWQNRGLSYEMMGKYDLAKQNYLKSIAIEPGNAGRWYNLGVFFQEQQLYDSAIVYFKKAESINSRHVLSLRNLGFSYRMTKNYDLSKKYYLKAINADSTDASSWIGLGSFFFDQEKFDSAVHYYLIYLRRGDTTASIVENTGYAYLRKGDLAKAELYFRTMLRFDPAWGNYHLACLNATKKDYQQSLYYLEEALKGGFKNFEHLARDTDMEVIRSKNEYLELLKKYKK